MVDGQGDRGGVVTGPALPLASWTATDTLKVPVPVAWMFWFTVGWAVKVSLVAKPGGVGLREVDRVGAGGTGRDVVGAARRGVGREGPRGGEATGVGDRGVATADRGRGPRARWREGHRRQGNRVAVGVGDQGDERVGEGGADRGRLPRARRTAMVVAVPAVMLKALALAGAVWAGLELAFSV